MNTNQSYGTFAPDGQVIESPININLENDIYGTLTSVEDYRSYYQDKGYVIIRNLIDSNLCEQFKQAFYTTIKPHQGYFYRQVTGNPETHQFNSQGLIINALLNIQDLETRQFSEFKQLGLKILTDSQLHQILQGFFDEPAILVQSMFFEGNSETWPHQDTYYLDASNLGKMVGIWIALEDINAAAGRFFIYPYSHRLEISNNKRGMNIATQHHSYKQKVMETIKASHLKCYAPYLKQGDVLFWHSHTIHGSLKTEDFHLSRCSLTGHYIPQSNQLLQYQKRLISLNLEKVNQQLIHHPKSLDLWYRKLIFYMEVRFPHFFQGVKKKVIQILLNQ
ncbi:MAG: phytanoyl-CoA dioxygenase family protein [Microcystaceae cyanobacterium]